MIFPFSKEHEKQIIIRQIFTEEIHKKVKRIKKLIQKEIGDSWFFDYKFDSNVFTHGCYVLILLKEKDDYEKQFEDI